MIGLGLGLVRQAVRNASGQVWTPARLFSSGEQGVWYEPKTEYLYQDAAGTIPVTADGDPVGLMLDLHKGLVKGPELVTNGTFDTDSDWEKINGTTISGGAANFFASFDRLYQTLATGVTGKTLQIEFDYSTTSTGGFEFRWNAATSSLPRTLTGSGRITLLARFTTSSSEIQLRSTGWGGSIDNVSIRELPGNHATQSTSAARPIYRTDGVLHWLEFDGVDDFLETGIWTLNEYWFVSYAISQAAYANYHGPWRFLVEGGSPVVSADNRLEDYTRDVPDRAIYSRVGAVGKPISRETVLPAAGTRYVGWAGYNPDASYHVGEQWDGNEQQVIASDLIRSPGTGSLSISRAYSGDFMPGNYYGMVFMTGTPMGDDDRELVNAYMRSRGGITL